MSSLIQSWDDFWDHEARELCNILPPALVGGAPVSVLLFQPSQAERLVYLNRRDEKPDPIPLPFGPNAKRLFFDLDPQANWHSKTLNVEPAAIEDFLAAPLDVRERFYAAETNSRYTKDRFDSVGLHLKLQESYRIQATFPSPLYHHRGSWWKRLPRLGICYTVAEELGKADDSLSAHGPETSDRLLLICGISAGNRILGKRLRLIFGNTFQWPRNAEPFSAENVAKLLCTKNRHNSDQYERDQQLYLIAKLTIAHHILFPQNAAALRVVKLLGVDHNDAFLVPNGWQAVNVPDRVGDNLELWFGHLVNDLMFLIHALVRWEHPEDIQQRLSENILEENIRQLALDVLTLLCGVPDEHVHYEYIDKDGRHSYLTVMPPARLLSIGNVTIPGSREVTIKTALKDQREWHEFFLHSLCPLKNKTELKGLNAVQPGEIEFCGGNVKVVSKTCRAAWAGAYLRARFRASRGSVSKSHPKSLKTSEKTHPEQED